MTLSSVAEFFTLPTPTSTKSKPPGSARVLTSAESLTMIIEKEQKKKEEEEAKEARKREREEKLQREAEKERKAKERELKRAWPLKGREKRLKLLQTERQRKQNYRAVKPRAEKPKKRQGVSKVFVTRSKTASGYAPQHHESGNNECTLCFRNYNDDLSDDGTLTREWIQCTDDVCGKWMHEDCPPKNEDGCSVCPCGA